MRLLTVVGLALLASCATPHDAADPREAIASVLAEDERVGKVRNHAPESGPIAAAVVDYVAELDALDLEACPPDFAAAMRRHRDAWAAMIPYLEAFPDERGEMHDVFDRLAADSNPTKARFDELLAAIWSTWGEVEAAVAALDG